MRGGSHEYHCICNIVLGLMVKSLIFETMRWHFFVVKGQMSYQQTLLLIRKFLLTYHFPISSFHLKRINSEVKKIILELTWTTLHKNKAKLRNNPLGFGSFANWPLGFQFCNIIGEIGEINPSNYIFVNFANIKWPRAFHLGFIIISFFIKKWSRAIWTWPISISKIDKNVTRRINFTNLKTLGGYIAKLKP